MAGIGSTPFGYGTPTTAGTLPKRVAAANYLNPATKDYEQDPDTGELAQMPIVRQRVLLALTETFGSSSARPTDGILTPRKIGKDFQRAMADAVRQALRQLIEVERAIRVDDVTVRHEGSRAITTLSYTDLATGQQTSTTVPNAST